MAPRLSADDCTTTSPLDWMGDALCSGADTDEFDADSRPGETLLDRDARHLDVLARYCMRCPVRWECRERATELRLSGWIAGGQVRGAAYPPKRETLERFHVRATG